MTNADRFLALYARYGTAGADALLRRLGVTAPAGDVGKGGKEGLAETWSKVADALESGAKFAGVKGALIAPEGKGDTTQRGTPVSLAELDSNLSGTLIGRDLLIREMLTPPTEEMLSEAKGGMSLAEVFARHASENRYGGGPLSFRANQRPSSVGVGVEATFGDRVMARLREIDSSGIVRLLRTPATPAEIEQITREIDLRIMRDVWRRYTVIVPHRDGAWPALATCIVDMFRIMRAMTFDVPMRVIGAVNLYGWFVRRDCALALLHSPGVNFGFNSVIRLDVSGLLEWPDTGQHMPPTWYAAVYALKLIDKLSVFIHEARHATTNRLHNCNKPGSFYYNASLRAGLAGAGARILNLQDSSEQYGGAFAASKAFYESTTFHSGSFLPIFLRELMRDRFYASDAEFFCDRPNAEGIGSRLFLPYTNNRQLTDMIYGIA